MCNSGWIGPDFDESYDDHSIQAKCEENKAACQSLYQELC